MKYIFIVLIVSLFVTVGCSNSSIKTIEIGPEEVDCVGLEPMKCLVGDGHFFMMVLKVLIMKKDINIPSK